MTRHFMVAGMPAESAWLRGHISWQTGFFNMSNDILLFYSSEVLSIVRRKSPFIPTRQPLSGVFYAAAVSTPVSLIYILFPMYRVCAISPRHFVFFFFLFLSAAKANPLLVARPRLRS